MINYKTLPVALVSAALLVGCLQDSGSNDKSNSDNSSLKMQLANTPLGGAASLYTAVGDVLVFSDGATTFTITEARMNIRDIRFDTSSTETADVATEVNGPYIMDLVNGSALPQDITFDLPNGNYPRVDIRLDEANIEDGMLDEGDELLGNALVVKGTHNYLGVTDGTFTLTLKVSEDIRFEPVGGFVVDADAGADITLTYEVTDWLEDPAAPGTKVNLTACILADGLMDELTHHVAMDQNTQCTGITESIGNLIKENMKTKYDASAES